MTKDILVAVSGLQSGAEGDGGPIEVITTGKYYKKNGKHYILYEEVLEGFEGVTKSMIKLGTDFMDVTKKGVVNLHLMFEKNKKNVSYYYTPFGSLLVGIDAKEVKLEESEHNINVKVVYGLELNYEYLADCCITINVKSKEAGDFKI